MTRPVRGGGPPHSSLYARYNGFTLGAFLAVARYPFAADRYAFLRRRAHEFGEEAGLGVRWPPRPAAFQKQPDELLRWTVEQARRSSDELSNFVTVGAMAVLRAVAASSITPAQAEVLRERWRPKLLAWGVQESGYDEWTASLPEATRGYVRAGDVLTSVSRLMAFALEGVNPELHACFVAMPFRPRFLERYATFYAPALRKAGMLPLRAWGGVSSEEHYMTLMTVISRSGGTLAEMTGLNLNVVNEVGITHGLGKPAYLVAERAEKMVPTNLGHLPVIAYDPRTSGWQSVAVRKTAKYVRWMRNDYFDRAERYGVDIGVGASAVLPMSTPTVRLVSRPSVVSSNPGRRSTAGRGRKRL